MHEHDGKELFQSICVFFVDLLCDGTFGNMIMDKIDLDPNSIELNPESPTVRSEMERLRVKVEARRIKGQVIFLEGKAIYYLWLILKNSQ